MADVSLLGRQVARIIMHNGVHVGTAARFQLLKAIISTQAKDFAVKPGAITRDVRAESMVIVPPGVLVTFSFGEKLIPWSNIYEADILKDSKKQ